jgi:prevent-host-death family protein
MAKSLRVTIPATTVRRQFGDVVRRVHSGKEHFVVEKDGLPVAAIISMADYEALQEGKAREERSRNFRQLAREIGSEIERRGIDEAQFLEALEKTSEDIYQEYYGKHS